MTIEGFPRIAIDPAVCGGRPIIAGTRMRVSDIWEMLAGGGTMGEIVEDFPYLCEDDVREAVALASMMLGHPEPLDYERLLRRDRQVILTNNFSDETLDAILTAEPAERAKEAGRRLEAPVLMRYRIGCSCGCGKGLWRIPAGMLVQNYET